MAKAYITNTFRLLFAFYAALYTYPAAATDLDPQAPEALSRPSSRLLAVTEVVPNTISQPLVSPNRQWVAQPNDLNGESQLNIKSTDGATIWGILHPTPHNIGRTALYALQWSPDSKQLYIAERLAQISCAPFPMDVNLYVADIATRQLLPVLESIGTSATLSPDGTRLLYLAFNGRGIMIRDLRSGDEAPISAPYEGPRLKPLGNFVWSPNGHEAVFAAVNAPCSPDMTFEIIWLNVQSLHRRTLLVGDPYQMRPVEWRPNGRVALRDKDGRIWLMNPKDGRMAQE